MTSSLSRLRSTFATGVAIAATLLAGVSTAASAPVTAVPPADYRPPLIKKAATAVLLLPVDAQALRISLPAPSAAELAALRAKNAATTAQGAKGVAKALAIALPRELPDASRSIALDALAWQPLPDGSRAARIAVTSPGAAALRVALVLQRTDTGVSFRFAGSGAQGQVFGPIPANAIAADTARFGMFWTPVLEGDTAILEIQVEQGVHVQGLVLGIAKLSHQLVAPASLRKIGVKDLLQIGAAGSCEIDVACVTPQSSALAAASRAVAEMDFTQEDGYSYLCTGQLLNDSIFSHTPYFFTANHCMNSAMAARTLNTYWFFEAATCGSTVVPPYVQLAAGAALLARSEDWDWALVRLNENPPVGSRFAAWRAEPIPTGAIASVLHHPEGDLMKWSQGSTLTYDVYSDGSSFAQVIYNQGSTEPGSSGAALLTYFASGGYYEVRGGLYQGSASCSYMAGTDDYSRLDNMLPLTRQYLTPGTNSGASEAVVVEYYNAGLKHYFMTASPAEIADLETGVHPGWERTGLRFLAYDAQAPGTNPVCRFYQTPGYGDSHFYSASPAECQAVTDNPGKYPGWTYESPSVFYIALPDPGTGACPSGDVPVWRFFNQTTTNHRYTTDHTIRDQMRADPSTWIPEGYGADQVIMCSPIGS
ncbi:MAG TPA: trypsin-like peptidase domain-containing protein [Casimicrobiaceae bacterium]|nr:trypsin-like peptidase domain-containing protein [Casimicrobiaceae bacterium]